MAISHNINNALDQGQAILQRYNVPQKVASAIADASRKTGVDFAYLVEKAAAESSFRTNIKAKTSSATGLYQFIDSTWLQMVKQHGAKYGLGRYADAICVKNGKYCVDDAAMRQKILNERNNPQTAALMAAEFAAGNEKYLQNSLGNSKIGNTDLYMAHFMGAGGAAKFLKAKAINGEQSAAQLFPAAAKANRNVFYGPGGKVRSLNEVYAFFDKKFEESAIEQVLASDETQKIPSDLDSYVASNALGMPPTTFNAVNGTSSYQRSWDNLIGRVAKITKQDHLMQNSLIGGGLLAPETTMYMAALHISDGANEKEGAALWLEKDKNKAQNNPYKQNNTSFARF